MKLLVFLLAAASRALAHETISLEKEFKTSGKAMERLMSRVLEDANGGNDGSSSSTKYLSQYTIKFQGCHHIQQWNEDADENDEVKIMTKRLVRFRLVPANQCSNYDFKTVSAKYGDMVNQYVEDAKSTVSKYTDIFDDFGDYVVDLNTFVYAYLEGKAEEEEGRCEIYEDYCSDLCGASGYDANNGDDDASNTCLAKCYRKFGLNCDTYVNNIDPIDYAQCAALDFQNDDDAGNEYYLGPYCADQGGVIKMGIFTDNTCSTFAECGASCYETKTGYNLPGAGDNGLISESCMSCSSNYATLEKTVNAKESISDFSYGYTRNVCTNIHTYAGKCESHMSKSPDKTEAGCSYINGIKILASDGTVDSRSKVRSTAADLSMAIIATGCVFFGMYIFYLKDKLSATRFK